jgi:hypothetical protein
MKDYRISKEADLKLYEMMLSPEIRMAIQTETADRSFLKSPPEKTWANRRRNGKYRSD